ncbi:MAG TPA: OmpA family protein, partial [Cytophagales bacterium]|nr:OmpA family protein [Cytophagales bacterium]
PNHTKEQLNHKIEKRVKECEFSKNNIKKRTTFRTKNLGDHINSEYAEYSPFITSDESFIVFTSRRKGSTGNMKDVDNEFFEDIYYSKKESGEWTTPVNFGPPINTNFHEGCVGLSLDGKELYVFEETNGGDIYVSHKNADGTWTAPKNFSHKVNSKYYEPSLCVNQHKSMAIFSSNKPGGKGSLDLYYCLKDKKGDWTEPINLGDNINTEYSEESPYYDDHTNTLYFSSSGLEGFGGYDVFKSVYDSVKHTWSKPENMGSPINTTDDDLYFVVSEGGKRGYYSSVRQDGLGEKDLYMVEIFSDTNFAVVHEDSVKKNQDAKDKKTLSKLLVGSNQDSSQVTKAVVKEHVLKILIYDHQTKKGLSNADVEVLDSDGKVVFSGKTNDKGELLARITNKGDKFYDVSSVAPSFMYTSKKIEVSSDVSEYDANVDMHKLEVGYIEVLRHVYYDFNKSTLRPESYPELDKLVKVMTQNPYLRLEVNGHTDNIGGHEANIQLSQKRAESVVTYLISKGIAPTRLVAKGFGETKPIASNDDEEEGRELNRRTEVEVIK